MPHLPAHAASHPAARDPSSIAPTIAARATRTRLADQGAAHPTSPARAPLPHAPTDPTPHSHQPRSRRSIPRCMASPQSPQDPCQARRSISTSAPPRATPLQPRHPQRRPRRSSHRSQAFHRTKPLEAPSQEVAIAPRTHQALRARVRCPKAAPIHAAPNTNDPPETPTSPPDHHHAPRRSTPAGLAANRGSPRPMDSSRMRTRDHTNGTSAAQLRPRRTRAPALDFAAWAGGAP